MKKLALSLLFFLLPISSEACTLWAATNNAVNFDGSLLAKNRDRIPHNLVQRLSIFRRDNPNHYDFFALVNQGVPVAGINAAGLAVVYATVDPLPATIRYEGERKLIKGLLENYSSVAAVIQNQQKIFTDSEKVFAMLADKQQIAFVEIAPNGFRIIQAKNGVLYHTNGYVLPEFIALNKAYNFSSREKLMASSNARYHRIDELLSSQKTFSLDDFIRISQDHDDGPEKSIFRTGTGKIYDERTIATFIVRLNASGINQLYVRYLPEPNPTVDDYVVRKFILQSDDGYQLEVKEVS